MQNGDTLSGLSYRNLYSFDERKAHAIVQPHYEKHDTNFFE